MSEQYIDIVALAKLARLEVSQGELARLEKEIPNILEFVRTIQAVDVSGVQEGRGLRNVMRADDPPAGGSHESGLYTKKLLDAAPARDGDRIAVKQVISRNKKS